jgi:predicted TIM-barrel fold metal-dependent hydrolase
MIITDSGLHVWQAPTPERPWNPAKAHLKEPMSYEDLRVRMKEAGVDRAILVPPSFAGAYPDYSLEAAAKYPEQFAVMGSVPLNRPEGPRVLEHLMSQPGALGVRLTFHHEYDQSWIKDGTADWFWPVAEKMNIPVMMNDEKLGLGLAQTIELAKYPNVFVKLTSAPSCSSEDYPYRNIHPHLKRLIEAFGPRRCFWGTDLSSMLSRSKCTYRQAVTMFTEEMDFLSNEDLELVMGGGLAECLPWPVDPGLASRQAG